MYLTVRNTRGNRYLLLMESVHVPGKRAPNKRVIKNFGNYDKLPEEIRRQYEDAKAKKELAKRLEQQARNSALSDALHADSQVNQPDVAVSSGNFNRAHALCYGHLALKDIWDKELGLKYKLNYLQKTETAITEWSLNDLLFYLCASKVISPDSYLGASENKSNFIYCPWNGIAQDNFYRSLDLVYEHRDSLIKHAVKTRNRGKKQEIRLAFFDCTNTWFETPYDDITWQTIRFTRQRREELLSEGRSAEEIEAYLSGDEFAEDLAEELNLRAEDVLRMRGKSKEGRFSQPIVTVALAIDQNGFPIDCKVFAGNVSEMKTISPMLESLRAKYDVKDVYFVADRGLNSTEGLDEISEKNLGYVVAQKVSSQKSKDRNVMLDLAGYRNCRLQEDGTFLTEDGDLRADAFRYKVCDFTKASYVENEDGELTKNGRLKRHKVSVSCKIIYTYSPERRARDLADLESQIAKANRAVSEGCLMGNACGTGWRALVKTAKEAAQNKNDKEMYRAQGLKQDVIEERKTIAGYSALVFAHPKTDAKADTVQPPLNPLTDEQVLETYHKLVRIEDCFRVMKSTFSIRPVHVRLRERIVAHCTLCVLSLMLMRSLQEKLETAGVSMSSERISTALAQALAVPVPSKDGSIQAFLNLGLGEAFHSPVRTAKNRRQWEENEMLNHDDVWKVFESERTQTPHDTDLVLLAAGLRPLDLYCSMAELKRRLGIPNQPDADMIAPEVANYHSMLKVTR